MKARYDLGPCTCDLRDRLWNPNTARCGRCGCNIAEQMNRRAISAARNSTIKDVRDVAEAVWADKYEDDK